MSKGEIIIGDAYDEQKALVNLVNEMTKIRLGGINRREVSGSLKDKYLSLTQSLAARLKAVTYEPIQRRMGEVGKVINKSDDFLYYDPLQRGYWIDRNKDFVHNLDEILISLVGDEFVTVDSAHHFLQAIKYLTVEKALPQDKEKVYDTVLPFQPALPVAKANNFVSKLVAPIFGEKCNVENVDKLTLKIDGSLDNLDTIVKQVGDLGYLGVFIQVHENAVTGIAERFPGTFVAPRVKIEKSQEKKRFAKLVGGVIKYTTPISYPIIGGLPIKLRERVNNVAADGGYNFDAEKQCLSNGLTEGISGAVLAIVGMATANPVLGFSGAYLLAQTLGRVGYLIKNDKAGVSASDSWKGSPHAKLACMPLEVMVNEAGLKTYGGRDNQVLFIPITHDVANPETVVNTTRFYESLMEVNIPADVETNLVWNPGNHNEYGKRFAEYLSHLPGKAPIELKPEIDRQNQFIVYRNSASIGEYKKDVSLYFFNGYRYIMTTIVPDKNKKDIAKILDAVLLDKATEGSYVKKSEAIFNMTEATYIRLKRFEGGKQVNDYELTLTK